MKKLAKSLLFMLMLILISTIKFSIANYVIDEDITNININVSKYTIIFDPANSGRIKDNEKTRYRLNGEKLGELPVPTVEDGYTFDGWYENNKKADPNDIITSDVEYSAKYKEDNKIIYNLDNGEFDATDTVKYSYKDTDSDYTLPTPKRTGYVFLGWTGSNGSDPQINVVIRKGETGNKEYTAHWEKAKYNIVFSTNDLMKGKELKPYADDTLTKYDGYYILQSISEWGGVYLDITFEIGKKYVLEWDAQKIDGTLNNLNGHSPFENGTQLFKIDDRTIKQNYSNSRASNVANDTKVHHVRVYATYDGKNSNPKVYIQPNRGIAHEMNVTTKISNVALHEIFYDTEKEYGDLLGTLPDPGEITGKKFVGWFTQEDGKGQQVTSKTVIKESMTLFAYYTDAKTYNVAYRNMTDIDKLPKTAYENQDLIVDLSSHSYSDIKVYQNNIEINNFTYENGILTIPNVTGNIIIMNTGFDYAGTTRGMLLYADTKNSSAASWGDFPTYEHPLEFDIDNSLKVNDNVTLDYTFDASMDVNDEYTVMMTVKGDVDQQGSPTGGFAGMIIAISEKSSNYLNFTGYYKGYLNVMSYAARNASHWESEISGTGFGAIDIRPYDNKSINLTITAQRTGKTIIYINGEKKGEFQSGGATLKYHSITIGDLRPGRGLHFRGNIYSSALYNVALTPEEVKANYLIEQVKFNL